MRKIDLLAPMPDPFLKADGTRVTPEEWPEYKKALRDKIVQMEYGGLPPRPEVLEIQQLTVPVRGHTSGWYKIFAGTKEHQVSFILELAVPWVPGKAPGITAPFEEGEKYPVLLTGDMCYHNMESDTIAEANRRGYIAARFNRLELANDVKRNREGGLYDVYPDNKDFTDIAAWAWGYITCMDVFEKLSFVDATEVGITGHSRGGKTVLLAAVMDERIKYVCPNNSGCHGCASYRCVVTGQGEREARSERLADMLDAFPTWMGPALSDYRDREEELPYDMHFFGAMIAPRYYLQCEGMQDYWINPIGSWQTFAAVKECFRYLGCSDHAGAWFRPGEHRHKLPDFTQFLDFMDRARKGLPLAEHLQINPYPDVEKNFHW